MISIWKELNLLDEELSAEEEKNRDKDLQSRKYTVNDRFNVDNDTVKKMVVKYIISRGYEKTVTPGMLVRRIQLPEEYGEELSLATPEEMNLIETWIMQLADSEWSRKAKDLWNRSGNIRYKIQEMPLLASVVGIALENKDRVETQRREKVANDADIYNVFMGNEGDKVTFTINAVKIKEWNINEYTGGTYPVYDILDTEGHHIQWGCTSENILTPGDILTGTLKYLVTTHAGIKLNVVSRCKKVGQTNNYKLVSASEKDTDIDWDN